MLRDHSLSALVMGLIVAVVGYASTFAIVIAGLKAVGATNAEAASGTMAAAVGMGLGCIVMSVCSRTPEVWAWSLPAVALLATSEPLPGGFSEAVGAFLVSAALVIIAGLVRPVGRAVAAIPDAIANAMVAGILLALCLAPFKAVAFDWRMGLPIILAWLIGGRINRFLAVPAALAAFVAVVVAFVDVPESGVADLAASVAPDVVFVWPTFSLEGIVGLALPIFLVTMAGQNIPGAAIMKVHGWSDFRPGPAIATTGAFSVPTALFGGPPVNLSALTAAMCMGEDVHPDRARRYWASIWAGVFYCVFGLLSSVATTFLSLAPVVLIEAVAGLALFGTFAASARAAFDQPDERDAAAVTFLLTASGLSFFGIAGAFWGLVAGLAVYLVRKGLN